MLSNTCKYAIRAVIYLAIHSNESQKIGIKQISQELDIPSPFLSKILQNLAKHKLLHSTKGPHGGFCLGRPAENITLIDIVEIIDGLDVFKVCMIGVQMCEDAPETVERCAFHPKSAPMRRELFETFRRQTLAELAAGIGTENPVYL